MKVKEKDLVIGDEYWIDEIKQNSGFFIGFFNGDTVFYSLDLNSPFFKNKDNTIPFDTEEDYEWEEVE